jgi:hypothetical protein
MKEMTTQCYDLAREGDYRELMHYRADELRDCLSASGLAVGGSKDELIGRLFAYYNDEVPAGAVRNRRGQYPRDLILRGYSNLGARIATATNLIVKTKQSLPLNGDFTIQTEIYTFDPTKREQLEEAYRTYHEEFYRRARSVDGRNALVVDGRNGKLYRTEWYNLPW